MDTNAQLVQYSAGMWPHMDEHARRLVAASQAVELAGLAPYFTASVTAFEAIPLGFVTLTFSVRAPTPVTTGTLIWLPLTNVTWLPV
jgi:hypothetical protein